VPEVGDGEQQNGAQALAAGLEAVAHRPVQARGPGIRGGNVLAQAGFHFRAEGGEFSFEVGRAAHRVRSLFNHSEMESLEQVSRRFFADPSWLIKSVFGALLVFPIPVFALGYIYRLAEQGRRGEVVDIPEWDNWLEMLRHGLRFLALICILVVAPIFVSWLISWPWHAVLGRLAYLPMAPVALLTVPLTSAALYQYQRREDFRDALRIPLLFRMIVAARHHLVVPALAFIGFALVLLPVLPYALFTGGALISYYYALMFHEVEQRGRAAASGRAVIRR